MNSLNLDTRIIGTRESPSRNASAQASPVATPRCATKKDFEVDFEAMDQFVLTEMRLNLDRTNKIMDFEQIGMSDPLTPEKGLDAAIKQINQLIFTDDIYKDMDVESTKPPKSIFLPKRNICR